MKNEKQPKLDDLVQRIAELANVSQKLARQAIQ